MQHTEVDGNKITKHCFFRNKYFLLFLVIVVVAVLLLAKFKFAPKRVLWSEGKANAGAIARILKDYASQKRENGHYPPTWEELESFAGDAYTSTNFPKEHFTWEADYEPKLDPPIEFKITITRPPGCKKPDAIMFNNKGEWFHLDEDGKWAPD